jgi:hypothetical protein
MAASHSPTRADSSRDVPALVPPVVSGWLPAPRLRPGAGYRAVRRAARVASLAGAMAALACLDAESTGDLQHRKSDEVAVEDHAADRVLMEAQDSASPAGRGARSGGPGHGGLVEVGVLDGDPTKVFGRIWDIVVGPSGDVFVLDNLSLDLRWFTADGEFLGSAGRAGGGPGEFRSPMSVALRRDGLVEVLDMAHRRLSRFAPSERGLLLRSELTIPVFGMDFCEMRARYYVLANDSVGVVTVVDTLGTEVHSP